LIDRSGLVAVLIFVRHLFNNKTEKHVLSKCAVLKFLPFTIATLCEAGFSRYGTTKSEYHYTLDVVPDMIIQLYTVTPNFKGLCKK
jgi:hypothetical protein